MMVDSGSRLLLTAYSVLLRARVTGFAGYLIAPVDHSARDACARVMGFAGMPLRRNHQRLGFMDKRGYPT
jgi:hypothetical protein